MKKVIASVLVTVLLAVSLTTSVYAGRHGGSQHCRTVCAAHTVTLCNVENCHITGTHRHGGLTFLGHHMDDGCGFHQLCAVVVCTLSGSHMHNGVTYLPRCAEIEHNCLQNRWCRR
jgi:hypothetical protein